MKMFVKNEDTLGKFLIFLGAFFWSLNAPLIKFITLSSLLVCGLRSLIAGVAMMPFVRPKSLHFNRWMLLYICSFAALCISVIQALKMTDAAIAVGMQYTALVWLFGMSLIRHEKIRLSALIPVLLILCGMILFMSSGTGGSCIGNIIALLEGIFFACMTVSSKRASGNNPLGLTAIANLLTGLFVFIFLSPSVHDLTRLKVGDWAIMLILGVFQASGGYGCYNLGLKYITSQKASVIALWEMILGPTWVALFLHEYPSMRVIAGFIVILAGMLLDVLWPREKYDAGKQSDL